MARTSPSATGRSPRTTCRATRTRQHGRSRRASTTLPAMLPPSLPLTPDHDIPGPLLTELTALYAANRDFMALSGDFPDPDDMRPEQVAAALAEKLAHPDAEVLLARSAGRLVGVAITLARHPDPADPDP